jgi:hypothetical protein
MFVMTLDYFTISCDLNHDLRRSINLCASSVGALYNRLLPKVQTGPFGKIVIKLIRLTDDVPALEELIDVLRIHTQFDFDRFREGDDATRRRLILDGIQATLLRACDSYGWDPEPFRTVYQEIIGRQIINEEYVGKPVKSPDRTLTAQLYYLFGSEVVDVMIVVRDKSGNALQKIQVGQTPASGEGMFSEMLGKVRWVAHDRCEALSRRGKPYCEAVVSARPATVD